MIGAVEKEEMVYWQNRYSYKGAIFPPSYRIFERDRFLLQRFKENLHGKTLLEIGCLFPFELIVLSPSKYKFTYIGVDLANEALRAAKNYFRNGAFVRCSATMLPFREDSFDVLLSQGVIHHLSGGSDNIGRLSRALKAGGLFVLAEAVERRTVSVLAKLRRGSSSPHEGRLNHEKLMRACAKSGKIVHFAKNHSIVLGLFTAFIDLFPILQESKTYLRFITAIDQFTIRTLGRAFSIFNAGAYFVIFRKI